MHNINSVLTLLSHYGYLIVFFGVLLESAGVPLPGETILIAAGILVHNGRLDLGDTIAFGIMAAVCGDQIGYVIGRRGGRPFLERWGRYIGIKQNRLDQAELFFSHHGGKAVFLARFVAGLRVFGALMAGVSRMRWTTFAIYNTLGGAVWAASAVLLGFFVGKSYVLIERWIGRTSIALLVLVALLVIIYVSHRNFGAIQVWLRRLMQRPWPRRVLARSEAAIQSFVKRLPAPVHDAARWLVEHWRTMLLLLSCVLVPLTLIGEIITEVFLKKGLPWDVATLQFFHRHSTSQLDHLMVWVTNAGGVAVMMPATALVAGFLALKKHYRQVAFFSLAVGGATVLNVLAKAVFQRHRPSGFMSLIRETDYSFPSGHAMGSMAFFAAILILVWNTRWRWPVVAVGSAFTFAVGASRVYLGVHYPTDILAGWLASLAWVVGLHLIFTAQLKFSGLPEPDPESQSTERYSLSSHSEI